MKDLTWIDNLKFRVSYGEVGNDALFWTRRIPDWMWMLCVLWPTVSTNSRLRKPVLWSLPTTPLAAAMVAGRLVWGAVRFVLAGLSGSSFPFSAFLSGALFTAVPGIIAQLMLIPLIITALQKAKLMD